MNPGLSWLALPTVKEQVLETGELVSSGPDLELFLQVSRFVPRPCSGPEVRPTRIAYQSRFCWPDGRLRRAAQKFSTNRKLTDNCVVFPMGVPQSIEYGNEFPQCLVRRTKREFARPASPPLWTTRSGFFR